MAVFGSMKPALTALVFLCLLGFADAGGTGPRDAKGHGRKREGRYQGRDYGYHRSSDHAHFVKARSPSHSRRRRRRRSKSDSRTPDRRKPAEQQPQMSPGYVEYKKQKQEAAAWQERRLQAQALALCLEEREQQRQVEQAAAFAALAPPLPKHSLPPLNLGSQPASSGQEGPAAGSGGVPPLPRKSKAKAQAKVKEAPANGKIPVSSLKLLEAELGHVVSLRDKPLTAQAVETRIAEAKPAGQSQDGSGHSERPPFLKVPCSLWGVGFGFLLWVLVLVSPAFFFCPPSPNIEAGVWSSFRHGTPFSNFSHCDVAKYWETLSGIPIMAPGATVVFASVLRNLVHAHVLAE